MKQEMSKNKIRIKKTYALSFLKFLRRNHISRLEIHYFLPIKFQLIITNHCILHFHITILIPSLGMDWGRRKFSELGGDQKNCFKIMGDGFIRSIISDMWELTCVTRNFYSLLLFSTKLISSHTYHSHKKRKDSLEGSLDQVLLAAELEFPKILVPRLPQHTSNVNIECAGKSLWSR